MVQFLNILFAHAKSHLSDFCIVFAWLCSVSQSGSVAAFGGVGGIVVVASAQGF